MESLIILSTRWIKMEQPLKMSQEKDNSLVYKDLASMGKELVICRASSKFKVWTKELRWWEPLKPVCSK